MDMSEEKNKNKNGKVLVTFTIHPSNECNCLYLVGKFNKWNEGVYRMQRTEHGTWSLALELEAGHDYQYRYRNDYGVWLNNPEGGVYLLRI